MSDLYDTDFYAWAKYQAALLGERRFDLLDLEHLMEEVDDMAGRYRDALQSQMQRLLTHLLKLAYTQGSRDPERQWQLSASQARHEIDKLLRRHPSLRSSVPDEFAFSYPYALQDAHQQLAFFGDTHAPFPESCLWTLEQVLDEAFWPEG